MLLPLLVFLAAAPPQTDNPAAFARFLSRTAEEADAFQQNISKTVTQETLEQHSVMAPSRFRPRLGADAAQPSQLQMSVRQIVSEYSVGPFKESDSPDLHEFRQVISVDGRPVQSAENARHALALGMQSQDDRIRKRMLEDFAKHGLVDIATDYGIILLAFTRRGFADLRIGPGTENRIGTDVVLSLPWQQNTTAGGQLSFSGRRTVRQPLQGLLWVRKSDGLPLRIDAWAEYKESNNVIRDQASVEYVVSSHGFLVPVSVVHRHLINGQLLTENLYRYDTFRMFSSDAEVKFTENPDPVPTKK